MMMKRLLVAIGMSLSLAMVLIVSVHGADGRWKLGPDGCYFDANDEGPDQCTRGRWRVDSYGGCYFDALDSGPDQCAPGQAVNRVTVPASEPRVRATAGRTVVAAARDVRDSRPPQPRTSHPEAGFLQPRS
jgi:hypothetical protein